MKFIQCLKEYLHTKSPSSNQQNLILNFSMVVENFLGLFHTASLRITQLSMHTMKNGRTAPSSNKDLLH